MQTSRRNWLLVLLLFLVSFMSYFLRTSITVAQEQMVPELSLSFAQMGVITGIGFQLAYALGQVPAGMAGDLHGARRVLGWALVSGYTGAIGVALGMVPLLYLVTVFEERELVERFGDEYLRYRERVPRLIPRLRG